MNLNNQEEIIRINYRKEGEEKTIIASTKDVFETRGIGHFSSDRNKLTIDEDIEFLHLKNVSLLGLNEIECKNKETILFIENCELYPLTIFRKGNIILEIPRIVSENEEYYSYHLLFCENEYVEFLLGNQGNYENKIFQINGVKNLRITGNASKLIIKEVNRNERSNLQNLYIKQTAHYFADVLESQNIYIEESEVESLANLRYKKLNISDSTISSSYNNDILNLNQGEVHIKNSLLKGKKIIFPKEIQEPANSNLMYFGELNKENLLVARFNLISCLKQIQEQNEEKPIPLDFRQLKQVSQVIFRDSLTQERYPVSKFQREEDYYKNQFTMYARRVRSRNY